MDILVRMQHVCHKNLVNLVALAPRSLLWLIGRSYVRLLFLVRGFFLPSSLFHWLQNHLFQEKMVLTIFTDTNTDDVSDTTTTTTTTTTNNNNNNNNNVIIKTKISYPLLFASMVLNKRLIRFYHRKETENTSLSQAKESQPPPTLAYNYVSRPRITLGMEGSSF